MRLYFLLTFISCSCSIFAQENPLETEKWITFFAKRVYEEKALEINDATFWQVSDSYVEFTDYPLLIIYGDGTAKEITLQYEGLHSLIDKKTTLLNGDFERFGKEDIAYMVFEGLLLKNPMIGNAIEGDFLIVYKKGPLSLYREYYTSPIERDNIESVLIPYHLSEPVENFHLGSFAGKASRLVKDYKKLSNKVKKRIPGYTNVKEEYFIGIATEYNEWVKENYPYRYADHTAMFWETPDYY